MSASFTTFCSDAIVDAAIRNPANSANQNPIMTLSITTDTGDYLSIHFRNEVNFKAFCAKHNFTIEGKSNAK